MSKRGLQRKKTKGERGEIEKEREMREISIERDERSRQKLEMERMTRNKHLRINGDA